MTVGVQHVNDAQVPFSRFLWIVLEKSRSVLLVILTLVAWEAFVRFFDVPVFLLPAPSVIGQTFLNDWHVIALNLPPTMIEIVAGFILSLVIGVPLAIIIVYSPMAESFLYPPMVASQAIPKVAIAPLFIVWMGYGLAPKIWIAFLIAFFPIVIDTVVGLRSIHPGMLQLGRSMGGGSFKVFLKLRLPTALPNIFAGMKVAITLAVVGAITGEFVGSQSGLGYLMTSASGQMDTPLVFAVLVAISVIAMALFVVIELIERISIPWHSSSRTRGGGH